MAQNGRLMRIKAGDGGDPETFTAIAGAREESFTLENGEINITNKDSNARRELLDGGTQSINLSVSGVHIAGTSASDLFSKARAGSIDNYEIEWEDGETLEGAFQVRNFERTGNHEGEVTFTCELQSSGDYTHSAAP